MPAASTERAAPSGEQKPALDRVVSAARLGDSQAAERLLECCRSIAERVLPRQQVPDGTQLLAELAMSRLDPARGAGACWAYLLAAARTSVRRAVQRGSLTPRPPEPPPAEELEGRLDEARLLARLPGLVERLPPKKQHAVRRFYFDGEPIAVIASELGCPPSTIKARLHAARQQLRIMLSDGGGVG